MLQNVCENPEWNPSLWFVAYLVEYLVYTLHRFQQRRKTMGCVKGWSWKQTSKRLSFVGYLLKSGLKCLTTIKLHGQPETTTLFRLVVLVNTWAWLLCSHLPKQTTLDPGGKCTRVQVRHIARTWKKPATSKIQHCTLPALWEPTAIS